MIEDRTYPRSNLALRTSPYTLANKSKDFMHLKIVIKSPLMIILISQSSKSFNFDWLFR